MSSSVKSYSPKILNCSKRYWTRSQLKNLSPLPLSFYLRKAPVVAKDLLGKGLFISHAENHYFCQIIEVEAYLGQEDPASHAYKGPTQRNGSMFKAGGTCYVYLSYGLNFCMNIATDQEGRGSAVLLRAAIPLMGLETMAKNRHISNL